MAVDKRKKTITSLALTLDQQEALGRMATRQGVSRATLIRQAVQRMIDEETKRGLYAENPDRK